MNSETYIYPYIKKTKFFLDNEKDNYSVMEYGYCNDDCKIIEIIGTYDILDIKISDTIRIDIMKDIIRFCATKRNRELKWDTSTSIPTIIIQECFN